MPNCALSEIKGLGASDQNHHAKKRYDSEFVFQAWLTITKPNAGETGRFKALASSIIHEFTHDELQNAKAVAEVTYLAPDLNQEDLRFLLSTALRSPAY